MKYDLYVNNDLNYIELVLKYNNLFYIFLKPSQIFRIKIILIINIFRFFALISLLFRIIYLRNIIKLVLNKEFFNLARFIISILSILFINFIISQASFSKFL